MFFGVNKMNADEAKKIAQSQPTLQEKQLQWVIDYYIKPASKEGFGGVTIPGKKVSTYICNALKNAKYIIRFGNAWFNEECTIVWDADRTIQWMAGDGDGY